LALQLLGTNVIRKEVELGQVEFDLQVPWQAQEQGTPDAMGADASLGTLFILLAVLQLHASQKKYYKKCFANGQKYNCTVLYECFS